MRGLIGKPPSEALQRIERSLRPIPGNPTGYSCFALADTLIRFGAPTAR